MKKILIIGAGRSSSSLIKYLLDHATNNGWHIRVADLSADLAVQKTKSHPCSSVCVFNSEDAKQREEEIKNADLVISMLPAFMHYEVAKDCVRLRKHLITASYVSDDIKELDAEAKKNGVLLLNEIGLDPGIDHLSAMKIIDHIKRQGGELISFRSYCGGLVAPESNDNPWGYKFTWNPRNVVLAGQSTAHYRENGRDKFLPYNRLFEFTENIHIDSAGDFDGYANRDSLSYLKPYHIENIPIMLRGTLRMPGYCKAWNALVKIGLTDDSFKIKNADQFTYSQLLDAYIPGRSDLEQKLAGFLREKENSPVMQKIEWLGLLSNEQIKLKEASPAQILQSLLEEKWKLQENDKDMIVMVHFFEYRLKGITKKFESSLIVKGEDQIYTAMAKTVGLPMAIAAKLILQEKTKLTGVVIPVMEELYNPVLNELEELGIRFREKET